MNKAQLISKGNEKLREIGLDLAEHALRAVNSYSAVKEIVRLSGDTLHVGVLKYDLASIRNLYVLGAGKATMGQARALDEILGERITEGVVIVKEGQAGKLENIEVLEGGHPIPDERSFEGAKKILETAKNTTKDNLVFYCDSGGSTALMSHPAEGSGISFEDEVEVNRLLLNSGAPIYEMLAVRRHITAMKGGRMQQLILSKGAEMINFIIPDNPYYVRPSPNRMVPRQGGWEDETTFVYAVQVLRSHDLWEKTPQSIRRHLENGVAGIIPETPKDFSNMKVHTFTLGNISMACEAAQKRALGLGLNPMIVTTVLEGESREAGIVLAGIAKEVEASSRPARPPCVLIFGGETTVTIKGAHGEGGPSQELALGFSLKIDGNKRIACLALDTDGSDGPTEMAGGIVDGHTISRARNAGSDVFTNLMHHNSSCVLRTLGDAVFTGPTDTNVCDLNIIVVGGK